MIDEREFWRLIDESREAGGRDAQRHGEELRAALIGRSRSDLEAFSRIFDRLFWDVYDWDVLAVGYLLMGGMGSGFDPFREWLISQGERIYRLSLDDPDALADIVPADEHEFWCEEIWLPVHDVYEEAFGEEMPIFDDDPIRLDLSGEPWDERDVVKLERRFPKLWARFERS